ncbi:MAG: preprotein translocase subunit SecE [Alphaproteobacteria bacterium CG_4_10_14_0_8_um_filter_53_9]|nr:MAG: preprotein translocase subunit SecE [Alphaproteobacteria bacterium CG_4_10_14_0_8_um_filter_53_9]
MNKISQLFRFGHEVKTEAGRITWPAWKDTRTMTIMVFILASLIALFLVGVDLLIGSGLKALLGF